jgi:hypothetical protein
MADKIMKTGKFTFAPGDELPYVGQVVPHQDEFYSITRLAKLEWAENKIRVHFLLEKVEEETVVVTDTEVRKAKKSKFKVL